MPTLASVPKEFRDIIRQCMDQGCELEHGTGSHALKLVLPGGRRFSIASSPSDVKSRMVLRQELRALGLRINGSGTKRGRVAGMTVVAQAAPAVAVPKTEKAPRTILSAGKSAERVLDWWVATDPMLTMTAYDLGVEMPSAPTRGVIANALIYLEKMGLAERVGRRGPRTLRNRPGARARPAAEYRLIAEAKPVSIAPTPKRRAVVDTHAATQALAKEMKPSAEFVAITAAPEPAAQEVELTEADQDSIAIVADVVREARVQPTERDMERAEEVIAQHPEWTEPSELQATESALDTLQETIGDGIREAAIAAAVTDDAAGEQLDAQGLADSGDWSIEVDPAAATPEEIGFAEEITAAYRAGRDAGEYAALAEMKRQVDELTERLREQRRPREVLGMPAVFWADVFRGVSAAFQRLADE